MRIHTLELTAYGPFSGHISLNFDELNQEGIFLLNGPTGSGKSSILDAICFALYGTTSSGRTDLRSRFASPQVPTVVLLECTIGQNRYRIERSPAYDRPKKRGSGTTSQPAKTLIEKFDEATGSWEADPAVTRHKDAADFMYTVLGLTAAQFNQVMLLPQGQFQKFLVASSSDREQLLKQLFGTYEFEAIQALLKDKAKSAAEAATSAQQELNQLTERAQRAYDTAPLETASALLGLPEEPSAAKPPSSPDADQAQEASSTQDTATRQDAPASWAATLTHINQLLEALNLHKDQLEEQTDTLTQRKSQLTQELKDWKEYSELTQEHEQLLGDQEKITAQEKLLASHRRALSALPSLHSHREAEEAAHQAQNRNASERTKAVQLLEEHLQKIGDTALEAPLLEQIQQVLTSTSSTVTEEGTTDLSQRSQELSSTLSSYAHDQDQLTDLTTKIQAGHQRAHTSQEQLEGNQKQLASTRDQLTDLKSQYADLEQAQAQHETAQLALSQAQQGVETAQALVSARQHLDRLQQQVAEAEQARRQASEHAEFLQQRRFGNAAQILAETLVEGQACSVCGSLEHPAPARYTGEIQPVSEAEVRQALEARSSAEGKAQQLLAQLATQQGALEQLRAQSPLELPQAKEQLQQAETACASTGEAVKRREQVSSRIKDVRQQLEKQVEVVRRGEHDLLEARTLLAELAETQDVLELKLSPHRLELSFSQRASQLVELDRALARIVAGGQEQERLQMRADEAEQLALAAMQQAGFERRQDVEQAALSRQRAEQVEREIQSFQSKLLAVGSRLQSPALLAVAEQVAQGHSAPQPELLDDLDAELKDKRSEHDQVISYRVQLLAAQQELTTVAGLFEQASVQSEQLIEQAHQISELAATANAERAGDNELRMTLTTYVLAHQLAEVAEAASEHLERMTHGRYRLEHTDRGESRRGKAGLGLAVYDAWHNAHRHPTTLSGGETFMASLALALGLADVVQAQNGGIEIDTLFVDEGFGSLDEVTLEEVMSTIDGLRERGRVIGLISHVAEMKNRISKHIVLKTSPQGSSLVAETEAA